MTVQAITVCINYSDYLECILANRAHFDRWLVVTVAGDEATKELCRVHDIDTMISKLLDPNGSDFDAAFNKSRIINEALDSLKPEGWALILDSDVLLPRHFRRRLDALALEPGCLYGLKGRRICSDRRSFEVHRACEPWENRLFRNSQPLGYFNLFHLESSPNRYPDLANHRGRMHDDSCFTELFPANLRRTLSMSALHAGAPGINWSSRASANYSSTALPVGRHDLSNDLANVLDQNYCNSSFTAVMIGYYPGGLASQLARRAKRLYMIDQFRIHHDTSNPMLRADRATLRACLNEELDTFGTAVFLGAHSAGNIATISDGSVDFLYLTGAIPSVCEMLIEALPQWLPKLSQDAIICGDSFAHSEWATGVTALFWLFGKPDHVETSGFWWKRLTPEIRNLHRRSDPTPDEKQNGVILVHVKEGDIEPLLLSIHSARAHWDGPIKVYYRGKDADPLRLACWRLRCDLHHLGAELPDLPLDGMDLLSVAALLPYQFALLLRSGMLVNGPLSLFFSEPIPAGASVAKGPYLVNTSNRTFQSFGPAQVANCAEPGDSALVVVCEGDPTTWTDSAWELWTERKTLMLEEMAVDVRVRADATLVFIADGASFGDLQQQWPAVHFPDDVPIHLVLLDVDPDSVWLPGVRQPDSIRHHSTNQTSVATILQAIATKCSTERVIFLPPNISPLPLAELFLSPEWNRYQLIIDTAPDAPMERKITQNVFVPNHFCGMVTTAYLRELAKTANFGIQHDPGLSLLMYLAELRTPDEVVDVDLRKFGWAVRRLYRYLGKDLNRYVGLAKEIDEPMDARTN